MRWRNRSTRAWAGRRAQRRGRRPATAPPAPRGFSACEGRAGISEDSRGRTRRARVYCTNTPGPRANSAACSCNARSRLGASREVPQGTRAESASEIFVSLESSAEVAGSIPSTAVGGGVLCGRAARMDLVRHWGIEPGTLVLVEICGNDSHGPVNFLKTTRADFPGCGISNEKNRAPCRRNKLGGLPEKTATFRRPSTFAPSGNRAAD